MERFNLFETAPGNGLDYVDELLRDVSLFYLHLLDFFAGFFRGENISIHVQRF